MSKHDALLAQSIEDHKAGRLSDAAVNYRRVLRRRPNDPDALHFYGLLHFHQKQPEEALALIRRSLTFAPANPHAWNNLGNILVTQSQSEQAKDAYRRVTELAPAMAEAWYNLAVCHRSEGALDEAVRCFNSAIAQQPSFLRAYEALAMLHYRLGRFELAAEIYSRWSTLEPENPIARHMAAATAGLHAPKRADDAYVAQLFDSFANCFDENLKALGYRAPELVAAALASRAADLARPCALLDAGCGTGLCGPLVRPLCQTLVGVDLSANMIDAARARGGYDELVVGELCAFMRQRSGAFDAVVSADTLVYFGDLDEPLAGAHGAMREKGLLVFTVEALLEGDAPYRLQVHGRYAHREHYVRERLLAHGFEPISITRETLRMERLQDVVGWLVAARRDSDS